MDEEDEIVQTLPIRLSFGLGDRVHMHQYPLLNRPLQVPPNAAASGKRISARIKPNTRRLEVHVPSDTRPDVWNKDRALELGAARVEDDREKNRGMMGGKEENPRLSEFRMRGEQIPQRGIHMLGVVHEGQLHLHRIHETHQFRPTLTYLDVLSKRSRQSRGGDDSDSDDGPPPDPDDPTPVPVQKKEKKTAADAKEVQVSARKEDKSGSQAGLSSTRKDMLMAIQAEEDEAWEDIKFHDAATQEAGHALENVYSKNEEKLKCKSNITAFLTKIDGL